MVSRFLSVTAAIMLMANPLAATADDTSGMDVALAGPVDNGSIKVVLNHAKIIKLSRPAGTVIVGNPEIADATVRDATTIILTGLDFGRTNMVVLDQTGQPVIDEMITVARDSQDILTVYRRADVQALSCQPVCERAYLTEAERQSIEDTAAANSDNDS